ncbi:MAG: hypothetical protein CMN73_04165 [Sphingomonas sp.]|nr:hypothetical protein [Sphingomonas sp.]|tara:strand:- start:1653 stop:1946 length:294 start_codon:yes stop_codon:yes gene_type:complete
MTIEERAREIFRDTVREWLGFTRIDPKQEPAFVAAMLAMYEQAIRDAAGVAAAEALARKAHANECDDRTFKRDFQSMAISAEHCRDGILSLVTGEGE